MRLRRNFAAYTLFSVFLCLALPAQAQEPVVSGFQHTSFSLSFDASSVDQVGNDDPDLIFRDVTFGVSLPLTQQLGLWVTVSKAADFDRNASDGARKLTGSFGGGLSYLLATRGSVTLQVKGGVMSRLEHVGDGALNPAAARMGGKVGWRVLGDSGDERWFGLFLSGGADLALRDIMSTMAGDILKGDTTYFARLGFEFSL